MTTVYLIRHAEAEGNLYRRCHGHYDAAITARGYRQIAALAKRFADVPVDAVWSSDLTRTQTTALAITRTHDLTARTTQALREVGVGPWEDRTWTWLARHDRERLVAFNSDIARWHVDGGQDMADVRERMLRALREIIDAHPGQSVAVFSHGMALRTLVGTLQGLSLDEINKTGHAENTAVTKLEADEGGIRVVYRDDASHLSDELKTLHKQKWTKTKGGIEPGVWFAPEGEAGRFAVMDQDDARVGTLALDAAEHGVARVAAFELDDAVRGQNYGIRLVGQAVSYARERGCDTLHAELARENDLGLRRAEQYGFRAVREMADRVLLELYFGYDEARRIARFEEAMKKDGC